MHLIFYRLQLGLKDFMTLQIKTCLYFLTNILENTDKKEIHVIHKTEATYLIVIFTSENINCTYCISCMLKDLFIMEVNGFLSIRITRIADKYTRLRY